MYRDDWNAVYLNQDRILRSLKNLENEIFLALCDRPDTIKDLFDLYFIFRYLPPINVCELLSDLNTKFEDAIGLRYELKDLIQALEYDLKWNIEIADIAYPYDLKEEINTFQKLLHDSLKNENLLDFSYNKRIQNNAAKYNLDKKSYLELIDLFDENAFWVNEVRMNLQP